MIKLNYIFWVSALFLLAGCATQEPTLQYSKQFLAQETATPRPAGMVFDPPYLASSDAFGESRVAGVNLNSRRTFESTAGYVQGGDTIYYQLNYSDYQGGGYGWGGFGWGGFYNSPYRAFYYTRIGSESR
jgi:hypothetical protein